MVVLLRLSVTRILRPEATRVVRHVRHHESVQPPTPLPDALAFTRSLLAHPRVAPIRRGGGHGRIFSQQCERKDATGNRVPDALHAALAFEQGPLRL